jgi:hypothetical protein
LVVVVFGLAQFAVFFLLDGGGFLPFRFSFFPFLPPLFFVVTVGELRS